MRYIQSNLIFYGFTISFHHSKEVFVCCLIVSLRCVFWAAPSIRGGGGIDSPRPASQRAAAFILTAAMLTTLAAPAFAKTWYIENGDITISAGKDGNDVTQNEKTTYGDKDTVITNQDRDTASSNTVTIEAKDEDDKVEVKLDNVNIDTSKQNKAAVSVTGSGDTTIELDGDNKLKSGSAHAGLEHNKTDTSGELTIQDNDKNGSLKAAGGQYGAGIGGAGVNDAQVKITGGKITATGGEYGAGIGGGFKGSGDVTISGGEIHANGGNYGAGIGGAGVNDAQVKITGGKITATGGEYGAGIGGGFKGSGDVTISGGEIHANGGNYGAGIGGGDYSSGKVTISGGEINATGGYLGAGIGGGEKGRGDVTITGGEITSATGGKYGAGIGGGKEGRGDVTIEGNTEVNAAGGAGGAGIGGGYVAKNNSNQITIKSNENGSPTVNAVGGSRDKTTKFGGAGIGAGGDSTATTDITLEGKVTINATAGKDNAAIGANGIEQEFPGLAGGTSITRKDSDKNDISPLPGDNVPDTDTPSGGGSTGGDSTGGDSAGGDSAGGGSSGGGSADASVQESVFPGLVVTDKDGQRISYTSIRDNNVLSLRVGRFTASLRASLSTLRQLRAEGIDTITFQTILCSTTLSVDELLAMGGEDAEVVLTHHIRSSTLTVGGRAV